MENPVSRSGEFRIMRFLSQDAFKISFIEVELMGNTYFIPEYAKHRPACRKFLSGELYEKRTHLSVAAFLKAFPGNMIHAGTFFGDMIPAFANACGASGLLYAFEPLLENYVLARLCTDRNGLRNVLLFNSALADRIGYCSILRAGKASGDPHMGGASRVSATGDVSSVTLTIDSFELAQLSILQLDVEGFELEALSGGRDTIGRCRPLIMVEDNKKQCDGFLNSLSYSKAGSLPGLGVWYPREHAGLVGPVEPFLNLEAATD